MSEFNAHGARFSYPETWILVDESGEDKVLVTVQSPGSAFWALVIVPEAPSLESMLASAEAAYQEDYPEGDIYPRAESEEAHGRTLRSRMDFVVLDLVVSAVARAYQIGDRTVMVLTQIPDIESELVAPVLEAISASLEIDDDPAWPPSLFGDWAAE